MTNGNSERRFRRRSVITLVAAVATVAVMLSVPLASSFDSDARLSSDSVGYLFEGEGKIPEEELDQFNLPSVQEIIFGDEMVFFNMLSKHTACPTHHPSSFEYESIKFKYGIGTEYSRNDFRLLQPAGEGTVTGITATYVITADQTLVKIPADSNIRGLIDALTAIKDTMGETVKAGDIITLTGSISYKYVDEYNGRYTMIDYMHGVLNEYNENSYWVETVDITMELKKAADNSTSSVKFAFDNTGYMKLSENYDYSKDVRDIKAGDKCNANYTLDYKDEYDFSVEAGGQSYSVEVPNQKPYDPPADGEEEVTIYTEDQLFVLLEYDEIKAAAQSITGDSDHIKVKKTYEDVESVADEIRKETTKLDEINFLPQLLIGGAAVAAAIVLVSLLAYRKRKTE